MKLIVFALFSTLLLAVPARAVTEKGYLAFAAKSDQGPSNGSSCRSFGGEQVVGGHYTVVMDMGRRDTVRANVIYHGGHQYVAFSIETSNFWGGKNTVVALCHFAG